MPELQGEPEEISKEKARLAAKEVPQKYALNVFVEFAYERMMNIWWVLTLFFVENWGKWAGAGGGYLSLFQCSQGFTR